LSKEKFVIVDMITSSSSQSHWLIKIEKC
jgi:hypothetical protein